MNNWVIIASYLLLSFPKARSQEVIRFVLLAWISACLDSCTVSILYESVSPPHLSVYVDVTGYVSIVFLRYVGHASIGYCWLCSTAISQILAFSGEKRKYCSESCLKICCVFLFAFYFLKPSNGKSTLGVLLSFDERLTCMGLLCLFTSRCCVCAAFALAIA